MPILGPHFAQSDLNIKLEGSTSLDEKWVVMHKKKLFLHGEKCSWPTSTTPF